MLKAFASGVIGIAVLAGGSMGLIAYAESHAAADLPLAHPVVPEPAVASAAAPAPAPVSVRRAVLPPLPTLTGRPAAAIPAVQTRAFAADGGVRPIPALARAPFRPAGPERRAPTDLEPEQLRALNAEITAQMPELARCWEDEPRAALAPGARPDRSKGTPATLGLELENLGSMVRVVDATLEQPGTDRNETVLCAKNVFRSMFLELPPALANAAIATPGAHVRVRFVLE